MVRSADCPVCHKPLTLTEGTPPATAPFCSKRCQQVDLYRWFSGKYAIVEDLPPDRLAQEMLESEDQQNSAE